MRYRSLVQDSARWDGFVFHPDDIVISTPPKSGTTWMQMLCALLIFDGPDLPAPLSDISPWLDMCNRPLAEIHHLLDAQTHRRFIKTHTPLDGVPAHPGVTYLVVGRDPRDVAVSYDHHRDNMDFDHFMAMRAEAVGLEDLAELPPRPPPLDDPADRFRYFMTDTTVGGAPNLAAVLHQLDVAWRRRRQPNVALFHYADMTTNLVGELLRLATALGIPCSRQRAAELVPEAGLGRMRERAERLAPSASQKNWKDTTRFFRRGGFGEWRAYVTPEDERAYEARIAAIDPALAAWMHRGRIASAIDPAAL
jgi:aryl sulfotransferase